MCDSPKTVIAGWAGVGGWWRGGGACRSLLKTVGPKKLRVLKAGRPQDRTTPQTLTHCGGIIRMHGDTDPATVMLETLGTYSRGCPDERVMCEHVR